MSYFFSKTVSMVFDDAVTATTEELKKEGFGVLTEIDVQKTLKEKRGIDFRPYRILGACNPDFAHQALEVEDHIGLMMPCNVVVQETGTGDIEVAAIDPVASMASVDNQELSGFAQEVRTRLQRVIEAL